MVYFKTHYPLCHFSTNMFRIIAVFYIITAVTVCSVSCPVLYACGPHFVLYFII